MFSQEVTLRSPLIFRIRIMDHAQRIEHSTRGMHRQLFPLVNGNKEAKNGLQVHSKPRLST